MKFIVACIVAVAMVLVANEADAGRRKCRSARTAQPVRVVINRTRSVEVRRSSVSSCPGGACPVR